MVFDSSIFFFPLPLAHSFPSHLGTFWDNVKKAISKSWPIGFLVRDILSRTKTYDNAVARLVDSPVIAPTYFMIAGSQPHQGRQITRERDSSEQPLTLSKERRFLIQPNMDHWSSDYRDDIMNSRQRRTLAESLITASLQEKGHLSENDFWTILSQEPIFNGLTVYGAAMSPSKGLFFFFSFCLLSFRFGFYFK